MNYQTFLSRFLIGTLFVMVTTLSINWLFDPLWYFSGNKVGKYNYAFNERLSKLNLIKGKSINCLVMGSSRVTFIRPSLLSNANCFNMAFSGGVVEEFSSYLKLLENKGIKNFDYLIVGVDGSNFFQVISDTKVAATTPSFFESYISIDALKFSLRLFLQDANFPRVYNQVFEVEVPNPPTFVPKNELQGIISGSYIPQKFALYQELVALTQPRRVIFYVPPLSAWHIKDLAEKGLLADYVDAIYRFADAGYTIVDYSVISEVTKTPTNTYDGHHYMPKVNETIAKQLNALISDEKLPNNSFGLLVNQMSKQQYLDTYLNRLKTFSSEQH